MLQTKVGENSIDFIFAEGMKHQLWLFAVWAEWIKAFLYKKRSICIYLSSVKSKKCFRGNTLPASLPVIVSLLSRMEDTLVILNCVQNCM
jgi:hypothetical protein